VSLELLSKMLLIRRFEEKCAEVYQHQKIRGFLHLYIGEEAVAVGAMSALRADDGVVATYREHGHALLRGITPESAMAEMYGKSTGCSHGRGGSMHLFSAESRFYGGFAIVGGGLPVAVGLALAEKLQGTKRIIACFFGDGATAEGEHHESLNLAAKWGLPVLFLCENNQYAMGTAITRYAAQTDLTHHARAHGIAAETVDGMDVLAVEKATRDAAAAVRESGTPRYLMFNTYRFRAHSMYDADRYRDKAEIARWKERDPIDLLAKKLRSAGVLDDAKLAALDREATETCERAARSADEAPLEPIEDLERDVVTRAVP